MGGVWISKAEEKLKHIITTTPDSTLIAIFTLFTIALFAVILGILILIIRKRKSQQRNSSRVQQSERRMLMDMEYYGWSTEEDGHDDGNGVGSKRWLTIRKVLMSSMRWSESSRWDEEEELIISSSIINSCCSNSNNSFCSLTCSREEPPRAAVRPEIRILEPTIDNKKSRAAAVLKKVIKGPLLGKEVVRGGGLFDDEWRKKRQGIMSSSSSSSQVEAVWQRPILMGGKCELPKHSGLILYDQTGRPLHHSASCSQYQHLHHPTPGNKRCKGRTTLQDLM